MAIEMNWDWVSERMEVWLKAARYESQWDASRAAIMRALFDDPDAILNRSFPELEARGEHMIEK